MTRNSPVKGSTIGAFLAANCRAHGISQTEAAKLMGLASRDAAKRHLSGQFLTVDDVAALAAALGLDVTLTFTPLDPAAVVVTPPAPAADQTPVWEAQNPT